MNHPNTGNKNIASILQIFTTGSLVVLTISILTAVVLCSMTLLEKDKQRAEIFSKQLVDSFEIQQRAMAQEMWIKTYEGIALRTASIAKEFDNSSFHLMLFASDLHCVYESDSQSQGSSDCKPDEKALGVIQKISADSRNRSNYLAFDPDLDRYIYAAPLFLGVDLPGYMFVSIEDPYDFYRSQKVSHYARVVLPGALLIVAIIGVWLFIARKYLLKPYLSSLVEIERNEALGKLAARVAHDIQSPLAALTSVLQNASGLPTHQNQLLKSAASRIQSLADDLIRRYKDPSSVPEIQFTLVSSVINSIVAEKVVTLGRNSGVQIHTKIDSSAKLVGIPLSSMMFSRVLSNVLNNAIDARQTCREGLIQLTVTASEDSASVMINDNGSGMSPDVLQKVRTEGGTYGKSSGAGIGLRFSKEVIEGVGGQLEIDSQLGIGTTVRLKVPRAELPQWCASDLGLQPGDEVVVLDDDPSILLLWRDRLEGFSTIQLRDPGKFDLSLYPPNRFKYIFDYEISGSTTTGLDLIRKNRIASRSVLVTSYFNDPRIQSQVVEVGTKILPKYLIASVPLMAPEPISVRNEEKLPDLVLLDDDPMTHKVWKVQGAYHKKQVLAVYQESELDWKSLPKDIPIYIDLRLANGSSGLDVAKRVHDLGFKQIFITSGDQSIDTKDFPFLMGVLGKTFPIVNS